jgi:NADPH:quinone reductase-like Zn-dependent oxidoreductase
MNPKMPPTDLPSFQPEAMQAWLYSGTSGGLEKNLHFEGVTRAPPAPQGNEVLVRVISAALNPVDYKLPEMGLPARMLIGMPASPGMDFCGRVVATGPLAKHFKEDQLVYGCPSRPVQFGSLGEYLSISADKIAVIPDGVSADNAAALPVAGLTAYQSLEGHVKAGQKVLINGASGGCGVFAIQIAKQMGCHVTTISSTRNIELCLRMGADEVIDYTAHKDLVAKLQERKVVFDCIVDHIGLPSTLYYQCHHFLKEDGAFVQVGASAMMTFLSRMVWPSFLGGGQRKYVAVAMKNDQKQLAQLGEWLAEGKIQVQLDSVFEFQDAEKAFEKLRSGRARGKIVVHVSDPNHQNMESFGIGL